MALDPIDCALSLGEMGNLGLREGRALVQAASMSPDAFHRGCGEMGLRGACHLPVVTGCATPATAVRTGTGIAECGRAVGGVLGPPTHIQPVQLFLRR